MPRGEHALSDGGRGQSQVPSGRAAELHCRGGDDALRERGGKKDTAISKLKITPRAQNDRISHPLAAPSNSTFYLLLCFTCVEPTLLFLMLTLREIKFYNCSPGGSFTFPSYLFKKLKVCVRECVYMHIYAVYKERNC